MNRVYFSGLDYVDDYVVNPREYIAQKSNQNVLVCGASGEGKSVLMRRLLLSFDSPKAILSFKSNDEYLKIGYPIADVTLVMPNPFQDVNAFITAFAITFPLDVIGVTASQVPALLFNIASECGNWKDFLDRLEGRISGTRDKVQLTALRFIDEHVRLLVYESRTDADSVLSSILQGKDSVVFDFSKLNENAKIFYSELLLSQLWSRLEMDNVEKKWMIVCVDEAYRLTRGTFQRYRSVLFEMARDIRHVGALWTSAQDYTDLQDDIRNQFETQFVFKTTAKADLDALRVIDPMMSWTASILPDHHFFDAKRVDHREVKVFNYHRMVATFEPHETKWAQELDEPTRYVTDEDRTVDALTVTRMAREFSRTRVFYASEVARLLVERYGLEENQAKLLVNDALRPLVDGGELRRLEFEREDGQSLILFYTLPEDTAGESILHTYLRDHLKSYLEKQGKRMLRIAEIGDNASDIETEDEFYEVETGLKKGKIADLKDRMAKAEKPTFIVVPNRAVAERYMGLSSDRVQVVTMRTLVSGPKVTG